MPRTMVIGDIHGAYEALLQCMERSGFDYSEDRLVCLGDICDRRNRVKECVDELLKIENLVMILGNHDLWALQWMESLDEWNRGPQIWVGQGGSDTIDSYREGVPEEHLHFFRSAKYYHEEDNMLFVHGGIDHRLPIEEQLPENFLWDRSLVTTAISENDPDTKLTSFEEVFVGHTPTLNILQKAGEPDDRPVKYCNIWLMDTGAGWKSGRLSIMDVETKEYWQSDRLG